MKYTEQKVSKYTEGSCEQLQPVAKKLKKSLSNILKCIKHKNEQNQNNKLPEAGRNQRHKIIHKCNYNLRNIFHIMSLPLVYMLASAHLSIIAQFIQKNQVSFIPETKQKQQPLIIYWALGAMLSVYLYIKYMCLYIIYEASMYYMYCIK